MGKKHKERILVYSQEVILRIKDFLGKECIKLDLEQVEKKTHIKEMVEILHAAGKVPKNKIDEITDKLMEREKLGSTGIGQGIAIPHIKTDHVSATTGALGISKKGVDFDSLDGEPVYISFLLLTPVEATNEHLLAISEISHFLKDKFYRDELRASENEKEAYKIIKKV
jgi:mannitol/fructose-specific phosphotransferase system IIA component (Ntr-type)